jgi:hypothetical protein
VQEQADTIRELKALIAGEIFVLHSVTQCKWPKLSKRQYNTICCQLLSLW